MNSEGFVWIQAFSLLVVEVEGALLLADKSSFESTTFVPASVAAFFKIELGVAVTVEDDVDGTTDFIDVLEDTDWADAVLVVAGGDFDIVVDEVLPTGAAEVLTGLGVHFFLSVAGETKELGPMTFGGLLTSMGDRGFLWTGVEYGALISLKPDC